MLPVPEPMMPPPGGSFHTPCCDLFSLPLCPAVPSGDIFKFREALCLCVRVLLCVHTCMCVYVHAYMYVYYNPGSPTSLEVSFVFMDSQV